MNKAIIQLALCHAFPTASNDASDALWLPLIPSTGTFNGRDGRMWTVKDADAVINNTQLPFVLDDDHASELSANSSASGWFTELKVDNGFIMGKLELNSKGKTAIDDKQYKYYSPAFLLAKGGKEVFAFKSVGLTNKPNLDVPALNSEGQPDHSFNPTKEEIIMLVALLAALGLAADVDQQTALNAVQKLKNQTPDLDSYVPKATFDQMQTELNSTKQQLADITKANHDEAVEVAINAAIEDKKIAPADKAYFMATCATEEGLESFRQFVANRAPVIGEVELPNSAPKGGNVAINSEQKNMLTQLGVNEIDLHDKEKA